jgi:hypothetical protein
VDAQDDKGVILAKFYIDEKLMLKDTGAPWGSCFNTRSISKGSHVLKVAVWDKEMLRGQHSVTLTK